MPEWPLAIAYALDKLPSHWPPKDDAFIKAFQRRWGDIEPSTLRRVLQHRAGKDRNFALLVLGYLATPEARAALLPFLASADPTERQISAIELGKMHEPRALPLLLDMLGKLEVPDEHATDRGLPDWWLGPIPSILGNWGELAAVAPLRVALQTAIRAEGALLRDDWQAVSEPAPATNRKLAEHVGARPEWQLFQFDLIYGLGQLGAFGALTGLGGSEVPHEVPYDWWRVLLVMGHLHGRFPLEGVAWWRDAPNVAHEVTRLLEHRFGLSPAECAQSLAAFEPVHLLDISHIYGKERLRAAGEIY